MLKETFSTLLKSYTSNNQLIDILWQEIEDAYSGNGRHYHTLSHLENLIRELRDVPLEELDTLLFSVFYHDIVYDASSSDNEEKSALFAEERLTQLDIPNQLIASCKQQILATKAHSDASDNDTCYFLDADLSVLGQPLEVYLSYADAIRREYIVYPDSIYNDGRKRVLNHFLGMERIFKTVHFFDKYEAQARVNLKTELEKYINP
jgi:predicted metal-dependent HD superfamily phosphohydrolase